MGADHRPAYGPRADARVAAGQSAPFSRARVRAMRAAVLAGGLGMRMRPYTTVLPKPLVPVGDRPILELIFGWLARHGVDRADVCIGHLGELIQTYFSQAQTIPKGLGVSWLW